MRCSVEGCDVENEEVAITTIPPGLEAFCPYHATGQHRPGRDLLLRPPCACGKGAAGFESLVGGYSARHTERSCFERTITASPDDVTAPEASPGTDPGSDQRHIVPAQKCACGRKLDGTMGAYPGFTESHSVRECIEQTTK